MIRAPKEFWEEMQNNNRFVNAIKNAKENGLSIDIDILNFPQIARRTRYVFEENNYLIKLFNLQWSGHCNISIPLLFEREYYVNMLNETKEKIDSIVNNKDEKKDSLEAFYLQEYKGAISELQTLLGNDTNQYSYNEIKKRKESVSDACADIIENLIKEFKSIKFCTDDMILY